MPYGVAVTVGVFLFLMAPIVGMTSSAVMISKAKEVFGGIVRVTTEVIVVVAEVEQIAETVVLTIEVERAVA